MEWTRILAYINGTVDQELLLRNEYLAAENQILRAQIRGRLLLSDGEKKTLADIGVRLGRKALEDVANTARPDTILRWYRELVARKFDRSKSRRYPGRPRVDPELEKLVIRMAKENVGWGYDRIVGALANLGYTVSDETVGNILRRNGIPPAPQRRRTTTWKDFIRAHMAVLAGTDFFTVEVLTLRGLVTYYVLFMIHLESRRVEIAGITPHPNERWVRSVKEEALSRSILIGEASLRRALREYLTHYHQERNHQGKDNVLLFPLDRLPAPSPDRTTRCRERMGGLLKYYYREAA